MKLRPFSAKVKNKPIHTGSSGPVTYLKDMHRKILLFEDRSHSHKKSSVKFSRADSRIKMLKLSNVSRTESAPIFRVLGNNWYSSTLSLTSALDGVGS